MPSLPAAHHPHMPPKDLLKYVWPFALKCLNSELSGKMAHCPPVPHRWRPAVTAVVANAILRKTHDVLHSRTGLIIVMETAIYTSKLDASVIEAG
jgi:hypothetical protein